MTSKARHSGRVVTGGWRDQLSYQGAPRTREQELELTKQKCIILAARMKQNKTPLTIAHNAVTPDSPMPLLGRIVEATFNEPDGNK